MGAAPVTLSTCLPNLLLDHAGDLRPHNVRETLQPLLERTTVRFGYWPGQQSQEQRVRFSCHVTELHWARAQTTKGAESTGSAGLLLREGHTWDRGDSGGDKEAAAAAGEGGACPAWPLIWLERQDLCVLPCLYIATRKHSQESAISSKG